MQHSGATLTNAPEFALDSRGVNTQSLSRRRKLADPRHQASQDRLHLSSVDHMRRGVDSKGPLQPALLDALPLTLSFPNFEPPFYPILHDFTHRRRVRR